LIVVFVGGSNSSPDGSIPPLNPSVSPTPTPVEVVGVVHSPLDAVEAVDPQGQKSEGSEGSEGSLSPTLPSDPIPQETNPVMTNEETETQQMESRETSTPTPPPSQPSQGECGDEFLVKK